MDSSRELANLDEAFARSTGGKAWKIVYYMTTSVVMCVMAYFVADIMPVIATLGAIFFVAGATILALPHIFGEDCTVFVNGDEVRVERYGGSFARKMGRWDFELVVFVSGLIRGPSRVHIVEPVYNMASVKRWERCVQLDSSTRTLTAIGASKGVSTIVAKDIAELVKEMRNYVPWSSRASSDDDRPTAL